MKVIELSYEKETVQLNGKDVEFDLSSYELLKTVINSPVQGGYSASDMLSRVRLLDAVTESEKTIDGETRPTTIVLEDADYDYLTKLVKEAKWSIVSKVIVNFIKQFDIKK